MFSKKKSESKGKRAKIDTLIGQNSEVHGDVVFSGGLHVDGVIKGNVSAEADSSSVLSVSERGMIEGEVRVPNIVLNGKVRGDVHAAEHVELAEMARVTGNVYYKLIEMMRGAEVNGNLVHQETPTPKAKTVAVPKGEAKPDDKKVEVNT